MKNKKYCLLTNDVETTSIVNNRLCDKTGEKVLKEGMPVLNSTGRLKAMIDNTWKCHDGILINVDPDASITSGCYVKNRGKVYCKDCGFTPVAEASGALDLRPGSLFAGWKIFLKNR